MIRRVEPLFDRMLVRQEELPETSAGGVIRTAQERELNRPLIGEVVAVGPDVRQLKAGETVAFPRHAQTPFQLDETSEKLLIMREEDVVGRVVAS